MSGENRSVSLKEYERIATSFAAIVDTKPHNAYYERPATLSLLPDVRGKHVLDAGCGPGAYAERLAEMGAEVVAVDASAEMVRLARERLREKVTVLRADFGEPLKFSGESFDVVLSALAMDYVEDWGSVFREFNRVLCPGGHLLFSAEHPFFKFAECGGDRYSKTELTKIEWRGFDEIVEMPSYRRPLEAMISPLIESGFVLERMLEPQPTTEFSEHDPEGFEKLSRMPAFICFRAAKRP